MFLDFFLPVVDAHCGQTTQLRQFRSESPPRRCVRTLRASEGWDSCFPLRLRSKLPCLAPPPFRTCRHVLTLRFHRRLSFLDHRLSTLGLKLSILNFQLLTFRRSPPSMSTCTFSIPSSSPRALALRKSQITTRNAHKSSRFARHTASSKNARHVLKTKNRCPIHSTHNRGAFAAPYFLQFSAIPSRVTRCFRVSLSLRQPDTAT
jgi:hypothetical protein